MKAFSNFLAVLSLFLIYSTLAAAQEEDCWHYENGDAHIIGSVDTDGDAYDVAVTGTIAYVADLSSGLQVIDISAPDSPEIVGVMNIPDAQVVVVYGNSFAYVAGGGIFRVLDISVPGSPVIVGSVEMPEAWCVAVSGSYAYVAVRFYGLKVIDLSIPESPQIVGGVAIGGGLGIAVAGSHAYVAARDEGLKVIDISIPESPQIVATVDTPSVVWNVAISGSHAYAISHPLQVIDISNPEAPQTVGSVDIPANTNEFAVAGSYAYLATGHGEVDRDLLVIDLSTPESPQVVGGLVAPGEAEGIAVKGDCVYLACGWSGLQIAWRQCEEPTTIVIDIKPGSDTNPINCRSGNGVVPVAILTTDIFDATTVDHTTVRFGPDEAAEAHQNPHGVIRHEEDVDDDGDMDLMCHFRVHETGIQCGDTEATLTGQTYDGLAFSGTDQIRTVPGRRSGETLAQLIQVSPNPFNPSTTLSFSLDWAAQVTISVFDMTGRRVAVIVDQVYSAGLHTVEWNGRDASGATVSSGPYLVRMETEDRVEARKVMLVR